MFCVHPAYKRNQYEFRNYPKIKWLNGELGDQNLDKIKLGDLEMLTEFVPISFIKPDESKTLNINISGYAK